MKLSEIKKKRRTKNTWTFREVDSLYEAYRRSYQEPINLFYQNFGTGPPLSPRRDPATKKSHTPIHDRYSVGQLVEIEAKQEPCVIQEVIVDHSQPLNIQYKVKILSGHRINREVMIRGWHLREPLEAAAKNY